MERIHISTNVETKNYSLSNIMSIVGGKANRHMKTGAIAATSQDYI